MILHFGNLGYQTNILTIIFSVNESSFFLIFPDYFKSTENFQFWPRKGTN